MADIRFVAHAKRAGGWGRLFINGHEVDGVIAVKPDLFTRNSLATVTVEIAVDRFEFVPPEETGNDG